jgi:anhydro-N-acetylmuramic acid kinase
MDGIDAALVKINNNGLTTQIELLNFKTFPYPRSLQNELLEISQPGGGTVDQICSLNFLVGEYFADAVLEICKLSKLNIADLDLIGSHGQTIHHLPNKKIYLNRSVRSTLQIGEPAVISNRTKCITVANFRPADMALGGQGAPLVPYFDYLVFRSKEFNRVILNIGGIANVTILKRQCSIHDVLAYDTGPGNMVINALMKKLYDKDLDEDGKVAQSGTVSEILLSNLMKHTYFSKAIPKSTGREEFGAKLINQIISINKKLKLKPEDLIATVTELTGFSIAEAIKFSPLAIDEVDELIISGGGIHNQAITRSLAKHFYNSRIVKTDELNIPGDAKEAICFAVLANETIHGNKTNLPAVTGAEQATILGSIYCS